MILVVGGAGYIGSHAVKELLKNNHQVIVLDNLSTGHEKAIDNRSSFIQGDIKDQEKLDFLFSTFKIDSVMHFAANCYVGESITNPIKYYENNVAGTISLLKSMIKHNIKKIIFSSTCAVYGTPNVEMITENVPTSPINPYGKSKLMIEEVIRDFSFAYGMEYIILRYFNVAGADPNGEIGEDHNPETHLIPSVLFHLLNRRESIVVYGNNYNTIDGTCIRDYIHVSDLVNAHILALHSLQTNSSKNKIYNVGNQQGYSVKEVIQKCEKITGKKATIKYSDKRIGDPEKLISSSSNIQKELNWKSSYSLDDMIQTAWNWFSQYPKGYKGYE